MSTLGPRARTTRPRPARRRAVRRVSSCGGLLVVCLLLTGCAGEADPGTGDPTRAGDATPAGEPTSEPTSEPTPEPASEPTSESATGAAEVVAIVSATAAGGSPSTAATPLVDEAAVQAFVAGLGRGLADQVVDAARTSVPAGRSLWGAVVALGCDVPPGVVVTRDADQVVITPEAVASPRPECLAPVTSVALVLVPDAS